MDAGRRRELEHVMAGLAAGDVAMVAGLVAAFGDELRRTLLVLAAGAGLRRPATADLDGLVFDAAAEIASVAGAWDPAGGAVPWVWARQRLLKVLRDDAGPPVVLVADAAHDREAGASTAWCRPEPPVLHVLDQAARQSPPAALVRAALERAVPARDHEVLLLHAEQAAAGDPSPAVTVGRHVGRSPDAVRQAVYRSRRRLVELATNDARFRALLTLPLLGPAAAAPEEPAA